MPLRVRYVECDMQGRAFNGHYLTWVDMAHTEALRELVGGYQVLVNRGIDFVVAAAELQFRQPARFDDELLVHVAIEPPGRTSLRSRYVINRGTDVIAEAAMRYPVRVVEITAPPAILAARLAGRGREDEADIARRLQRQVALPGTVAIITVMNDTSIAEGAERLKRALLG